MNKRHNIMAARKYEAGGETRTQWVRLGTLWVDDETGKIGGALECVPAGPWFDGRIHAFRADEDGAKGGHGGGRRRQESKPEPARSPQTGELDDEIPF